MHCIKLLIYINSDCSKVYKGLSTVEGLSNWWTELTTGDSQKGSLIDFRFGEPFHIQMKVVELVENQLVKWQCTLADKDWIGTIVTFNLKAEEDKLCLRFTHDKWPTHGDFFAHCNLSWAKYLLSLKQYIETGQGKPFRL